MSVKIEGQYPVIERRRTGLFSLDVAVGNKLTGELGLAQRTITEIYGHPNVGKSTLTYYLSGKMAQPDKKIAICDLEMLDREYLARTLELTGYDGTVKIMDSTDEKGKPLSHEDMLMEMASTLYGEETGVAVLDSIGSIQPIAEASGDFGEAFMGKRAKLVAQVCRSLQTALRNKDHPSAAFIINHVYDILGGRGHTTAGGKVLTSLSAQRIMLWTAETLRADDNDPNSVLGFYVNGQTEKLRYGPRGGTFGFYIVPNYGVHQGASAMFDCFEYGIAERGTHVKIGGKSLGFLKKDLLTYAATGKQRKFDPFVEALQEYESDKFKSQVGTNAAQD